MFRYDNFELVRYNCIDADYRFFGVEVNSRGDVQSVGGFVFKGSKDNRRLKRDCSIFTEACFILLLPFHRFDYAAIVRLFTKKLAECSDF